MTDENNSNASSPQSQIQTIGGDIFPRPLRDWILKISRRMSTSKEKTLLSSQEKEALS